MDMDLHTQSAVPAVIALIIAAYIAYADVITMWPPEALFYAIEFLLVIGTGAVTYVLAMLVLSAGTMPGD